MVDQGKSAPHHARWVRATHWGLALAVLVLAFSGVMIFMVHPRLYWGLAGNDMTAAWLELPIGPNYRHGGWAAPVYFAQSPHDVISASRIVVIFNQNGWARSLHFLGAWLLVGFGATYALFAGVTGHGWRNLLPGREGLRPAAVWADLRAHLAHRPVRPGPPYNVLQRWAYSLVLAAVPVMVLSGLAMSPYVTAGYPWVLDLFGGHQTARSVHFLAFSLIVLFVVVHLAMVLRTGALRQVRAMTIGAKGN
jgi:thiosulfate reductase cytochrome b subunit